MILQSTHSTKFQSTKYQVQRSIIVVPWKRGEKKKGVDNWKLGYAIKLIVTVAIIAKGENERHKDISQFASSKVYAFG